MQVRVVASSLLHVDAAKDIRVLSSSFIPIQFEIGFKKRSVWPKNIWCRLLNCQPQLPHRALTEKHPDASSADGEDDPLHFSVHKQGVALGRSVDLTKFDGYDQLIEELDQLFEFKGELMAPNKNWMIVFTDNEDDMMLVGDDPWQVGFRLVKILKKYDKRTGALIRQPFIEKVLQQPFFTTDLLYKLVKECVAMLDHFFPSNNLSISAV
ncbi:hypothetical protein ZIOFF_009991 [Zingiber officinale]|uniref:PB1 domain-containing protein n=1 Tax=Zingiber officinale TaxID=94328 RepID=A0A8J5HYU7_ZINOF|nr:hypothetical protein ZIOFF_009991 [Zingiber officinale]